MTDKELLELAAKAAGWDSFDWLAGDDYMNVYDAKGRQSAWNPLSDDGDALRLAVKLGIDVIPYHDPYLARATADETKYNIFEIHEGDPYAATRRAIVRAAAEIGRTIG